MTPVLRFHRTGSRGSTPPCRTHRFADPPGRMPEGPEPRGRLGRPRSPTDRRMAPPPVTSRQANGGRRNRHEPNASAEPTSGAAPNPCPFKLISARADPLNEYLRRSSTLGTQRSRGAILGNGLPCKGGLTPSQAIRRRRPARVPRPNYRGPKAQSLCAVAYDPTFQMSRLVHHWTPAGETRINRVWLTTTPRSAKSYQQISRRDCRICTKT